MPSAGGDAQVRIDRLKTSLAKAKRMKKGATLTSEPMAELLNVSWETLRQWTNKLDGFDASKAYKRGGRGKEWAFKPVQTIEWLIAYHQNILDGQIEQTRRTEKALGMEQGSLPAGVSIGDVDKTLSVIGKMEEQKRLQGLYVLKKDHEAVLQLIAQAATRRILNMAQVVDPNGILANELREKIDEAANTQAALYSQDIERIGKAR